jgi:hypothetical protein
MSSYRKIVQRVPYRVETWMRGTQPNMVFDLLECGHGVTSLIEMAPQHRYLCRECRKRIA